MRSTFGLQSVLLLNATSCIGFGLLFISLPAPTAMFLANEKTAPVWLIVVLGAGLIANGVGLTVTARQQAPQAGLVRFFSIGDLLWVVATLLLITTGWWINTSAGISAALLVAALVGCMGWLQWRSAG
ncbi:MAG: hypothetical protein Tsb0027_20890 [Wenzhouxiangellaceae bacterium]